MLTFVVPFPDWLVPMAATLTKERFTGPEWTFERKYDGIRLIAFKRGADVQLYSRNHLPQHVPPVACGDRGAPGGQLILDGELDWDQRGTTSSTSSGATIATSARSRSTIVAPSSPPSRCPRRCRASRRSTTRSRGSAPASRAGKA